MWWRGWQVWEGQALSACTPTWASAARDRGTRWLLSSRCEQGCWALCWHRCRLPTTFPKTGGERAPAPLVVPSPWLSTGTLRSQRYNQEWQLGQEKNIGKKQNQTKQETKLKVLLTAKLQNHLSEKAAKILLSEWIKGEQKSLKTYKPPTSNNPVSAGKLHEPSGHPQPLRCFPSAPVPGSFLKTEDVIQRETPMRQDNTFCGKALKQADSL